MAPTQEEKGKVSKQKDKETNNKERDKDRGKGDETDKSKKPHKLPCLPDLHCMDRVSSDVGNIESRTPDIPSDLFAIPRRRPVSAAAGSPGDMQYSSPLSRIDQMVMDYDYYDSSEGYGYVDLDDPYRHGGFAEVQDVSWDAPAEEEVGSIPPESTSDPEIDFLAEHVAAYSDSLGPDIDGRLAKLLRDMWMAGGAKDNGPRQKALYEKYPRPGNVPFHRLDTNEEIFRVLAKTAKARDLRLRAIQGAFVKATFPIVRMVDTLLTKGLETLDTQALVNQSLDSIAMLAHGSGSINQLRRDFMKSQFQTKYAGLAQVKVPAESQCLFGDNLNDTLKSMSHSGNLRLVPRGRGQYGFPRRAGFYRGYQRWGPYGRGRPFLGEYEFIPDTGRDMEEDRAEMDYTCEIVQGKMIVEDNVQEVDNTQANTEPIVGVSICSSRPRVLCPAREQYTQQGGEEVVMGSATTQGQVGEYPRKRFLSKWDEFQAGRLGMCLDSWRNITSDRIMLQQIAGFGIEFEEWPSQVRAANEIRFSEKERQFLREELWKLQEKQVICRVEHTEGEFVSNVFLREKKEKGKYRMILNLKGLNEFVEYHHFKMDTLETALRLIQPGMYMASIDFSDAYYSVPVKPAHRKFLRFKFEGQLYEFTCLPNGLSSGPRVFTKILKIPLTWLRQQYGITITGYLDDTLILGNTYEEVLRDVDIAVDLFQELGFMISEEKSVLTPVQVIEFLGFSIDSCLQTVSIPEGKVEHIGTMISDCLTRTWFTIREVASLLGVLVATAPGNKMAKLYTKSLERDKTEMLRLRAGDYGAQMQLSDETRQDLRWWLGNLHQVEQYLIEPRIALIIYTDASNLGWGAYVRETGVRAGSRWTGLEAAQHINVLELLAMRLALQAFADGCSNIHVRLMTDNTTAMACINNQGSTKSQQCHRMAKIIWRWAEQRKIWLTAAYIPGKLNVEADEASRKFNDAIEWTLSKEIFAKIIQEFGKPVIDLFASRLNFKLKPFFAWHPDPEAAGVDALAQTWTEELAYAFPPFSLIGVVLQKIKRDQAQVIMVVPVWPTKSWFTVLLGMLVEIPIVHRIDNDTLFLPYRRGIHPLVGRLTLMYCKISGKPCYAEEFHRRWPIQCYKPGGNRPHPCTSPMLRDGRTFVSQGRLIPIKHL
jgi:hypothetical protein